VNPCRRKQHENGQYALLPVNPSVRSASVSSHRVHPENVPSVTPHDSRSTASAAARLLRAAARSDFRIAFRFGSPM
jgi:hypothetical protein